MSIYKKLLSAKKEMEAITKDSKNPFFKSNYFVLFYTNLYNYSFFNKGAFEFFF